MRDWDRTPLPHTDKGCRRLRGAFIGASLWQDCPLCPLQECGDETRQEIWRERLQGTSGEPRHWRASLGNSSVQFPEVSLLSQKKDAVVPITLKVLETLGLQRERKQTHQAQGTERQPLYVGDTTQLSQQPSKGIISPTRRGGNGGSDSPPHQETTVRART